MSNRPLKRGRKRLTTGFRPRPPNPDAASKPCWCPIASPFFKRRRAPLWKPGAPLQQHFADLGWIPVWDSRPYTFTHTPLGMMRFVDGILSWINPRYLTDSA